MKKVIVSARLDEPVKEVMQELANRAGKSLCAFTGDLMTETLRRLQQEGQHPAVQQAHLVAANH